MDIVMISSGKRPELLRQSLDSLKENSAEQHNVTLVVDGCDVHRELKDSRITLISCPKVGASAARNIGASSIPKYRRQNILTFLDDDVYLCKGWDAVMIGQLLDHGGIVSGHAHPYNKPTYSHMGVDFTNVISTVHMSMPWHVWDTVGFFSEPGGKGGSEDVDFCKRAMGYRMSISYPQCVIHCGISGIVGEKEMKAQNEFLVNHYKLKGVIFE